MQVWTTLRDASWGASTTTRYFMRRGTRSYRTRETTQRFGRSLCTTRVAYRAKAPATKLSPKCPSLLHRRRDSTKAQCLPENLRHALRHVTNPVVVLAATEPGCPPRAMTMSSFTSLTLYPTPLVTFNIRFPSRTLDALRVAEAFHVHILSGDETGAWLASRFTQGNEGNAAAEGVRWREGGVLDEDGVEFVLRCRLARGEGLPHDGVVVVRDHVLVVAEVTELASVGEGGSALAYSDRQYRRVGDVLKISTGGEQ